MAGKSVKPKGQILVEFEEKKGLAKVSLAPEDLAQKSARALDNAMDSIKGMAELVAATVQTIAVKPQEVEVDFGLKLDVAANALIAKTAVEASINVKLTWKSS